MKYRLPLLFFASFLLLAAGFLAGCADDFSRKGWHNPIQPWRKQTVKSDEPPVREKQFVRDEPQFTAPRIEDSVKQMEMHENYGGSYWVSLGNLDTGASTVLQILKKHTGSHRSAMDILRSNSSKYNGDFYKRLPKGASVYLSEGNELFIDPAGGAPPEQAADAWVPWARGDVGSQAVSGNAQSDGAESDEIIEEEIPPGDI